MELPLGPKGIIPKCNYQYSVINFFPAPLPPWIFPCIADTVVILASFTFHCGKTSWQLSHILSISFA